MCRHVNIDNTDTFGQEVHQVNAHSLLIHTPGIHTLLLYPSQIEIGGNCHAPKPQLKIPYDAYIAGTNLYIVLEELIHELEVGLPPVHPVPSISTVQ